MGVKTAGNTYPLTNASLRLVNSPKDRITVYTAVFIHPTDRWAIVACDWDEEPRLGIRWFTDAKGNPSSSGYCTWFILPTDFYALVLSGLVSPALRADVKKFLDGAMTGEELQGKYP